ncbi:unnamed protein product [Rhizoctonia solani]|uniref:Zn(2)-C6 fungal-type domain-containing protein n=1 Tax=Rhizoctonia solani TaxID=456999 RepID=A0A8H3CAS8_9AGAM|nr:unnamed protein product [Rhizoctonia solani]
MSYPSNISCVTCETRKKKCDGARGPAGCRRCVKAGILCGGYLPTSSRIPKPKRNPRNNEPQMNITHQGYSQHISPNEIPGAMTSSIDPPVLNVTSESVGNNPVLAAADDRHNIDSLGWSSIAPGPWDYTNNILTSSHFSHGYTSTPQTEQIPTPSTSRNRIPVGQAPMPTDSAVPSNDLFALGWSSPITADPVPRENVGSHSDAPVTYDQNPGLKRTPVPSTTQPFIPANQLLTPPLEGSAPWSLLDESTDVPFEASTTDPSSLSNFGPVLPLTPRSPGLTTSHGSGSQEGSSSGLQFQAQPTHNWPTYDPEDDADEDPEDVLSALLDVLTLDRDVESNTASFVLHSFTSWMTRFLFEPTRVIPLVRESIIRGHTFGPESYQRMVLVANTVLTVSKSTDYDLSPFVALYSELLTTVADARDQGNLTREMAVVAMESSHEFISIMIKICSLASVLNIMNLYAPVFRRACPESTEELVNLPRALTAPEIHLKLFATLDIVLGVVTNRPMFFRYNLEFPSSYEEELLNSENSPGLRWLYGVPDRLVVTLARMNTLLEDFGSYVDRETVQMLEKDIDVCKPAVASTSMDPVMKLGRVVVQECWRLVAFIYLYMALCGADSTDARVVRIQKKFMDVVGGRRRNIILRRPIHTPYPFMGHLRMQQAGNARKRCGQNVERHLDTYDWQASRVVGFEDGVLKGFGDVILGG